MAVCSFSGNSDMYGLGIRLGYYLQWFGAIFAAWLAPSEVNPLRFSIDVFVAATFLALIILTAGDVDSLQPVETYIILLLMFGTYLALVPIYLWRLLTRCDPYWDPTRFPIVNPGALAANLGFLLLIGVLVYQYWFWFARVPSLDRADCQQYGFLFGRVRLNSKASVVVNALLYVFLGVVCLYLIFLKLQIMVGRGAPDPNDRRRSRSISPRRKSARIQLLRNMEGLGKILVAVVVTLATELTIQWNEIDDVNTLSGAGQTIPFVIGLAGILRILYVYYVKGDSHGDDNNEYGYSSGPHRDGPLPMDQLPTGRIWEPPEEVSVSVPTRDVPLPLYQLPTGRTREPPEEVWVSVTTRDVPLPLHQLPTGRIWEPPEEDRGRTLPTTQRSRSGSHRSSAAHSTPVHPEPGYDGDRR